MSRIRKGGGEEVLLLVFCFVTVCLQANKTIIRSSNEHQVKTEKDLKFQRQLYIAVLPTNTCLTK